MTYGDFVVFVDGAETLSVGSIANDMRGWLLSLENQWVSRTLKLGAFGAHGIWINDATAGIIGGMSGSPILGGRWPSTRSSLHCGRCGQGPYTEGGLNPSLMNSLLGWLLKQVSSSNENHYRILSGPLPTCLRFNQRQFKAGLGGE